MKFKIVRNNELYFLLKDKDVTEPEKEEKEGFSLPKGSVLYFSGLENGTREDIRDALTKLDAQVAYVDYTRGNESGHVRLAKENDAKTVFEKLEEGKVSCRTFIYFYSSSFFTD